jgi:hypothetical protein
MQYIYIVKREFSVGMRDSEGAKVIPLGHAEKRAINFGEVSGQS